MDLVGTGLRLTSADLLAAANKVGVDVATIRAVIEVVTAGAGFDAKKRLKLLFEPHVFYKQLGPGPSGIRQSNKALHTPTRGPAPIPLFLSATIKSLLPLPSMRTRRSTLPLGVFPEIMGFNHEAAGFHSAKAMVTSMLEGEDQQLKSFANLLSNWKLATSSKNRDWRTFSLRYNGPNAIENDYDGELKAAFLKVLQSCRTCRS